MTVKDILGKLEGKHIFYPYYCTFCRKRMPEFVSVGNPYELFNKMPVIGAGQRLSGCPCCSSSDRERWQYYVIERYTNILSHGGAILHFAPEPNLSRKIKENENCNYLSADIVAGAADYTVDMTKMPFSDGMFDYIIANHVLEHISDEGAAISELRRCIKPDGKIILSFPICMEIDTFETDLAVTDEDRIKYYGQSDHVRLYGRDYCQRLAKYGLDIKAYSPKDMLRKSQIKRNAYIENDVALLCAKLDKEME